MCTLYGPFESRGYASLVNCMGLKIACSQGWFGFIRQSSGEGLMTYLMLAREEPMCLRLCAPMLAMKDYRASLKLPLFSCLLMTAGY